MLARFALVIAVLAAHAQAQSPWVISQISSVGGSPTELEPVGFTGSVSSLGDVAWNETYADGTTRGVCRYWDVAAYTLRLVPLIGGPSNRVCAFSRGFGTRVCGTGRTSAANNDSRAFVWYPETGNPVQLLATLGGNYSIANCMTSATQMAGAARDQAGMLKPVVWNNQAAQPTVLPLPAGATEGEVLGIDINGLHGAGWIRDASGVVRACAWPLTGTPGTPVLLLPAGIESKALSAHWNWSTGLYTASGFQRPSVGSTSSSAFYVREGVHQDLGTLGGNEAALWMGYGYSRIASGASRAIAYFPGGPLQDLNAVVPSGSGWVLESARPHGYGPSFFGSGTRNGTKSLFILSRPDPQVYCTSGTSSNGCTPTLTMASGQYGLNANVLDGQRSSMFLYSVSGRQSAPWGATTSTMCIAPPRQRTPLQTTGGASGACNGALTLYLSIYLASSPAALGQPVHVGDLFQVQLWYRDPSNQMTSGLTNAVEFAFSL